MFEGRTQGSPQVPVSCFGQRACLRRACCYFWCCGASSSSRYARLVDLALLATIIILTLPVTILVLGTMLIVYRCMPELPLPEWIPGWAQGFFGRGLAGEVADETGLYDRRGDSEIYSQHNREHRHIFKARRTTTPRHHNSTSIETPNMPWKFPFEFEPACIRFYGRDNRPCPTRTPTKEFFDPRKPTLLYVHGIEPGTTLRGFRETFVTPTGIESIFTPILTGNLWLDRGYNIAIFYWNQFSDDERPAVERKIYVGGPMSFVCKSLETRSTSSGKMKEVNDSGKKHQRKRRLVRRMSSCDFDRHENAKRARENTAGISGGTRSGVLSPGPSIADQLGLEIEHYFGGGNTAGLRIVGHSMGSQLVLETLRRIIDGADIESFDRRAGKGGKQRESMQSSDYPSNIQRKQFALAAIANEKVVLLDPFFGKTVHDFEPLYGKCAAERGSTNLRAVYNYETGSKQRISLETYVTSIIGEGWLGSYPSELMTLTNHHDVPLPVVSWLDIKQRHCIATHYYLCSIMRETEGADGYAERFEALRGQLKDSQTHEKSD